MLLHGLCHSAAAFARHRAVVFEVEDGGRIIMGMFPSGPAAPEPEEASAILVDGTPAGSDHGTPALPPRPRGHAPGPGRREARPCDGVVGAGGGGSST